ncbi:MAG: phosphoglycerate mutase, partial [Rhodanobacter sp.]
MSTEHESARILWLPALRHFDPAHPLRQRLAQADRRIDGELGYLGGLGGYFRSIESALTVPAAALTRELLAGDAGDHVWLSADPAWVQPDMNGVRLLACGQLHLDMHEAQVLAEALTPVFQDAGMLLEISTPDRWHLKLPHGISLPTFAAPEQALGEDLSQHLPQGAEGRRWRVLLNDIQVLLHQHPVNIDRRARGLPPVNSLWLWGGGSLCAAPGSPLRGVISDDLLLNALAHHAGVARQPRTQQTILAASSGWLIDLQDLPAADIASAWWPALQTLL